MFYDYTSAIKNVNQALPVNVSGDCIVIVPLEFIQAVTMRDPVESAAPRYTISWLGVMGSVIVPTAISLVLNDQLTASDPNINLPPNIVLTVPVTE